ncbi:peroxidase 31-like [Panicum miliaceum]|uniref:Peroxidase n=1 Tax=Panicum miliaceum TaxID=4540 RepID=A0A3L6PII3_PANMI|nr:peroxidase 31-like [Panicum miliaceum]
MDTHRRLRTPALFLLLLLVVDAAAVAEAKLKQLSHPTTAAGVLRVFFHDCFVSGCDASVLVAPSSFARSERDATQSRSLPGDAFEAVTRAKTALELECPGVVACADVLAIAAPPDAELPLANSTVARLIAMFAAKGFTAQELVALSGAHTLGFAHCSEFADLIFRRTKGGGAAAPPHDPTMNPSYAKGLQDACRNYQRDPTIAVFNDVMTPGKFDNMYFVNLQRGLGLLSTDQALWTDPRTRPIVQRYAANQTAFFADFARTIVKLGVQGVRMGRDGEVRRRCDMFNGNPAPLGP